MERLDLARVALFLGLFSSKRPAPAYSSRIIPSSLRLWADKCLSGVSENDLTDVAASHMDAPLPADHYMPPAQFVGTPAQPVRVPGFSKAICTDGILYALSFNSAFFITGLRRDILLQRRVSPPCTYKFLEAV